VWALGGHEQTGALRDSARIRHRLRGLGVRRRRWAHRDRPVTGWASLTDTEWQTSELVSRGLTNQQVADQMFVSVPTVAFHLRQVFRKLGIRSRVELTRLALEQDSGLPGGGAGRTASPRQPAVG
jgi:DNA-binding CsgD family transcriptional regulator